MGKILSAVGDALEFIVVAIVAGFMLLLLGIVNFGIMLWVISVASDFFFGPGLEANTAVLAAAVLASASIIAGAFEKKRA